METCNNNMDMSGSSMEPGGSRWNPTKEQIDLLENLYRQGVRTPSTEQIQQITSKLRAFGHIEGKNVFYWFQNHKARQRQKQKQDNIAILNRFMVHQSPPVPPHFATYPNVACHPSLFIPPPSPPIDFGCRRSRYQKLLIPGSYKRRPLSPKTAINNSLYTKPFYNCLDQESTQSMQNKICEKGFFNSNKDHFDQETLPLFPLHPSGNLQANSDNFSIPSTSIPISSSSGNNYINGGGDFGNDRPFIDFFCMDVNARPAEDSMKA
ncbi:hypothetical protein Leryth_014476 [Lithospermum erythrorhizon]|nr:hypothetical protein Leryth_014476 [Lithospermum erythrorhizon]